MPLILPGNVASATASTGYDVDNSCRFEDGDSAYMRLTPGSSATDSKKMTISFWCKRGNLGINTRMFSAEASYGRDSLFFNDDDNLWLYIDNGQEGNLKTLRVFRDCSAWYHIVVAIDTTQATDTNRVKFYINGIQETSFDSSGDGIVYPDQDYDITGFGQNGQEATIGADTSPGSSDNEWDGYLAEFVFIDGLQLAPTEFGEFDSDSPTIWKPKDVSGLTFGTNGFYLDFEDSADLGADVSGNSNDFTVTNLAAENQATDTPTNNFCTINPLANFYGNYTFSEGNTIQTRASSSDKAHCVGTMGVTAGKWYWEINITTMPSSERFQIGIAPYEAQEDDDMTTDTNGAIGLKGFNAVVAANGNFEIADFYGNDTTRFDSWTGIIGVALDLTDGSEQITFSKDGAWVTGSGTTSITFGSAEQVDISSVDDPTGFWHPAIGVDTTSTTAVFKWNMGNPAFAISSGNADANGYGNFEYPVPSGYYALCTKNLAEYG